LNYIEASALDSLDQSVPLSKLPPALLALLASLHAAISPQPSTDTDDAAYIAKLEAENEQLYLQLSTSRVAVLQGQIAAYQQRERAFESLIGDYRRVVEALEAEAEAHFQAAQEVKKRSPSPTPTSAVSARDPSRRSRHSDSKDASESSRRRESGSTSKAEDSSRPHRSRTSSSKDEARKAESSRRHGRSSRDEAHRSRDEEDRRRKRQRTKSPERGERQRARDSDGRRDSRRSRSASPRQRDDVTSRSHREESAPPLRHANGLPSKPSSESMQPPTGPKASLSINLSPSIPTEPRSSKRTPQSLFAKAQSDAQSERGHRTTEPNGSGHRSGDASGKRKSVEQGGEEADRRRRQHRHGDR
jgi:hypothetical protein